ncbi:hypothetical protein GCM10029964_032230 [Kibdelosporangium lantanae]
MTHSDDEILSHHVGDKPVPYATKVVVVDYDPRWPEWFADEAGRIRTALGPDALVVEHFGSTSVPGLPAKPIIDIMLEVPDSSAEDAYVPALEAAGYHLQIREPEWHEHRCLYKRVERGDDRSVNLHVYTAGCAEAVQNLLFRDWLRTHPNDLALYRDTKRELAKQDWKFVQNYADAKTPVITDIKSRAGAPETPCVRF